MNSEMLKDRCNLLVNCSSEAINWVNDEENSEIVGPTRQSKIQSLKRINRQAQKLERAVSRNMAVSVFGPSQAGKSFLVSVLARPNDEPLYANFEGIDKPIKYIEEINPDGQGESTGLVTRFTMNRSQTPVGYPIKLSVLSESDVIRILCNSFYMDGEQSELEVDENSIAQHFNRFQKKVSNSATGLVSEDIFDISEYINKRFGKFTYASQFKQYWEEIAKVAPTLSREDRIVYLSILWDKCEPFTDLYRRLTVLLDEMNHPEYVYAKTNALSPKVESIIDVKTLHKLYGDSEGSKLEIQTDKAQTVSVERSLLCALTSELEIPLLSLPHEIFEHTDLLDFPGARNRFSKPLNEILEANPSQMSEMYLRGKVAYLFDNYVTNQEVTSMLLCIPTGNMDTIDLPNLIDGWISDTIGNDSQKRVDEDNVLFFVLTKFDELLVQAGGDETNRFTRRIEASLKEKFGKAKDNWIDEWTPGQPFQNCFWLRNPNFPADSVIIYDEDKKEKKIREDREEWIDKLFKMHNESELVQQHFKDPNLAWNSALGLNDGGVALLLQELQKVCKRDLKSQHITNRLFYLTQEAINTLPNPPGETSEERIKQAAESVEKITNDLKKVFKINQFGKFIASLTITHQVIRGLFSRIRYTLDRNEVADEFSRESASEIWSSTGDENSKNKQETYIAVKSIETWLNQLTETGRDELVDFGMDTEVVTILVKEIQKSVIRLNLVKKISSELERLNYGLRKDNKILLATLVCVEEINKFVAFLGIDEIPDEKRPMQKIGDEEVPIFRHEHFDDVTNLAKIPRDIKCSYWNSWVLGLDYIVRKNVDDNKEPNSEQFLRLREVINKLYKVQEK